MSNSTSNTDYRNALKNSRLKSLLLPLGFLLGCAQTPLQPDKPVEFRFPGEKYFKTLQPLSFGGVNTRARWSSDSKWITYQFSHSENANPDSECDQIHLLELGQKESRKLTHKMTEFMNPAFLPNQQRIVFSVAFSSLHQCAPDPTLAPQLPLSLTLEPRQIYGIRLDSTDFIPLEPVAPRAHNSEVAICQNSAVVFTSSRIGGLHLFRGQLDNFGTLNEAHPITQGSSYHGGAAFSPDCKSLVWDAFIPKKGKETIKYQKGLEKHQVQLPRLEIWFADQDGSHAKQLTRFEALSFAPTFTPDGTKILFTSNLRDPRKLEFDLYLMNRNGSGLEKITHSNSYDSFPAFSPDGKYLVFSSKRGAKAPNEVNLFLAEWVQAPLPEK